MKICGATLTARYMMDYKTQGQLREERNITHTPERCTTTRPPSTKTTEVELRLQRRSALLTLTLLLEYQRMAS